MVDSKTIKDKGIVSQNAINNAEKEDKMNLTNIDSGSKNDESFFSKISGALKKAIDCCRE